ncbi:MAG TPA: hypothetical protein VNV85_13775 [Puia sp.]|jgi:hypothetical protein|nr:hypothetical protein [Puia sp.]
MDVKAETNIYRFFYAPASTKNQSATGIRYNKFFGKMGILSAQMTFVNGIPQQKSLGTGAAARELSTEIINMTFIVN